MKGHVLEYAVWLIAIVPLFFFLAKFRGRHFLTFALLVLAAISIAAIANIALGIGLTENLTTSLKGHIYLHRTGAPFSKGDLIAFRWHGGATYPAGETFIKHVIGVPGDIVQVEGSSVWVNDTYIGVAKPVSKAGIPLSVTSPGRIPNGEYFVATENPNSLDSRYSIVGNIKQSEIIGRAYELF